MGSLRLWIAACWLVGVLGLCGCAAPSLYVQPSDTMQRSFPTAPPTIIRLPVKISVPKLSQTPKDLTHWIDQEVHRIAGALQDPRKLWAFKTPLSGIPETWENAQEPIFIDKDIWLLIQPEGLSTGWMRADPHNPLLWDIVLEMTARPILIFGKEPAVKKRLLPPLRPYRPGPAGFHAISDTVIPFTEANRILADPKSGLADYPIPESGSYHLRVKGVKLYGSNGQVIAQTRIQYDPLINLDGKPAQMTIYFRGFPQYDPAKQQFYLKHLDFDVKTGDFIMRVASWIFKSDILKILRQHAHIPIGPKLNQLKDRMNVVLNCPVGRHSRLETHVDSFRVLDSFVDRDGIRAQMSLDGTAQLELFDR